MTPGSVARAHLGYRHGWWFFQVPMTQELTDTALAELRQVVGVEGVVNRPMMRPQWKEGDGFGHPRHFRGVANFGL